MYDYEHLWEYFTIESFKKLHGRHYFRWEEFRRTSFCSHKAKWIKTMDDLCEIGLAEKAGNAYTTKRKICDEWIASCIENDALKQLTINPKNNHIHLLDIDRLQEINSKTKFKDYVYVSLIGMYQDHGTLTRNFIKELTGCSKHQQLKIEERNSDYIEVSKNYKAVDTHEVDWVERKLKKGSSSPCFPGYINQSLTECFITDTKRSNCYLVQTGNVYKINHTTEMLIKIKNIVKYKNKKNTRIKNTINYFDNKEEKGMSEAALGVNSRASFDEVSLVLDLDKQTRSEFQHYLTPNNMGKTGYKKFKRFFNDFQNMFVLDSKGNFSTIGTRVNLKLNKKWEQKLFN
jgi:hypothetical protein